MPLFGKRKSAEERRITNRDKRSKQIADAYKRLYAIYANDPRPEEEKAKDLLFTLALCEWERDRYYRATKSPAKRSAAVKSQIAISRQSAPFFIEKEMRPTPSVAAFYRETPEGKSALVDIPEDTEEEEEEL